MKKTMVTVLGIGNRLMMDDGIGIRLVEEMMKERTKNNINYRIGESDIEYSIDVILNSEYTIIIDAIITGNKPGTITIIPFEQITSHTLGISPHDEHLFINIAKFKELKGIVIGIEISEITYHYGISSTLEKELSKIKMRVKKVINEYFY